jgi:hypothetical protein
MQVAFILITVYLWNENNGNGGPVGHGCSHEFLRTLNMETWMHSTAWNWKDTKLPVPKQRTLLKFSSFPRPSQASLSKRLYIPQLSLGIWSASIGCPLPFLTVLPSFVDHAVRCHLPQVACIALFRYISGGCSKASLPTSRWSWLKS